MSKGLAIRVGGVLLGVLFPLYLSALEITGYTPTRHDRFSTGYPPGDPPNLVPNTNSNFIGLGYDWSGVGWNANSPTQSVALLGPKFFLEANHSHVGYTLQFFSSDGNLKSYTVQAHSGGLGSDSSSDLCLGVLSSPIPASDHVTYYPILFLGYSMMPYLSRDLLVYGRSQSASPRIGAGIIDQVIKFEDQAGFYLSLPFDPVQDRAAFESGDSGSPSFIVTGRPGEIYLTGAHYAVDQLPNPTVGFDSALPLMLNYVENYMAQSGYLPYVVTPPTAYWTGYVSNQWGMGDNWSTGMVPVDTFSGSKVVDCASVLFDGDVTSVRLINLVATRMVTGVTFQSDSGSHAFTFLAGQTLQIGEAGIDNRDNVQQTFNCNLLLRSSQRWDGGSGGLLVTGAINTSSAAPGYLLVVDGSGNTQLSGTISGTGGLSKDGTGTLTLSGTNNYSGSTFILGGTLKLGNPTALGSTAAGTTINLNAALDLNGQTLGSENITLAGTGPSGGGALINSYSTSTAVLNGLTQLTGNAAIGGSGNLTLSGPLDLATHTLTKSGSGTVSLNKSQTWGNGSAILAQAGTLAFAPQSGAVISLGTTSPTLTVAAGATVNVQANQVDPFTDTNSPALHVQIVNNSSTGLNLLGGSSQVSSISGGGKTTVSSGATLTTGSLIQSLLTVGSGGKVVIAPSASSSGGLGFSGEATPVPEPSACILLILAAILGLGRFAFQRRR